MYIYIYYIDILYIYTQPLVPDQPKIQFLDVSASAMAISWGLLGIGSDQELP